MLRQKLIDFVDDGFGFLDEEMLLLLREYSSFFRVCSLFYEAMGLIIFFKLFA